MKGGLAWFALLLLSLLLITAGFQGSLGRYVAVIFVPGALEVGNSEALPSGGGGSGDTSTFG